MILENNMAFIMMAVFVITSVCYLFIVVATYLYDSHTKIRRDYLITGMVMFSYSFFFGALTITDNEYFSRIFWSIGFFSGCMFFPVWLHFVSNLIPIKNQTARNILKVAAVLSALLAFLCITFGEVTFEETTFGKQFYYRNDIFFSILFGYILVLSGALVSLHILWFRKSELKRNRRQVLVLIIISFILTPLALVTEFIIPIFTDTTFASVGSIVILPAAMFVFYSMRKYKLFGITVSNVSADIFSSVTRPIYVLDNNNYIIIENNAAIDISGNNSIGENISDLILVNNAAPEISFFENSFIGETVIIKTASGIKFCDMALTVDKDNFNEAICKIVVLRDITSRMEMEDKLREALHEAIDANRIKDDFLAKTSHEIRTPMNAIIGMTELVLREKTSETVREHVTTIRQASSNLLTIINDLLDLSKIEAGNIQLRLESYSLASLIDDVVNIIRIKVYDSPVDFILDLDGELPDDLYGDEGRIRQILINLLGNAAKHTNEGHILLKVNGEYGDNDILNLILSVEDTGSGIKQDDLEHLFNEYFQVRSESEGVGLGLAITQGIVSAMEGKINVESEYGKGTTFTITLPQKIENRNKVADAGKSSINESNALSAGKKDDKPAMFTAPEAKVLVVDDIKTNLKVVNGFLEPYKMSVDLCLSGNDAIEMVKSDRYDLVFMDYRMPDMDGIEATKIIRALDNETMDYAKLPIIALTADAVAGRKEMFIENGFNDFMSKPIDDNMLYSILESWIPKHLQIFNDIPDVDNPGNENSINKNTSIVEDDTLNPDDVADMLEPIEGIDISKGVKLSGGTIEYYYETLASFHSDVLERLSLIRDCIETGDLSRYTTFIHALKSASANIGATETSERASALENAGDNGDRDYIKANNDEFISSLETLLDNIKAALTVYDAKNEKFDDTDINEKIHNELCKLISALNTYDIVATNRCVESLLGLASTDEQKKAIRDISQHILLFEYDKAQEIIKGLT